MTDDHARPIPRRPATPGSAAPGGDDVYVVDTRRRAAGRPRPPAPPPAPAPDSGYDELGRPLPPRRGTPPPPPPPPPGPRRRRSGRTGLRVLLLLLLAWVAFVVVTPAHAWSTVSRVDASPEGERPPAGDGHTYLLVGSDSREGLTAEQRKVLGTGSSEGRRTDTIILVHVPSGSGKAALISVPRDSFLPIPGNGENKVNAAFAIGGPKLLAQTLEQATGLRIDGYLEIGFGGFANVVDSLGGVDICVQNDIDDEKAHINLTKGCQTLDGPTALGYVRARYSDPKGDIGRAERQRQFLGAVMKKAATPATVLVPWRWWGFTHAGAEGVLVGEDTGLVDGYRIAATMRAVSNDDALSLVVPIANANATTSAGSSVVWNDERAQELFTMLREGTPLDAPPPGTDGEPTG
ncbi:LCP family protein [uncultured Phycicoccus sp.]|uniref:LCP family protein n=1 Tax=uncultured Phycicoccus sp. TaxID=661422 RepID=UPI00262ADC57|nr:LCP family protein [uncultured Phycicoccus sp.]